MGFCTKCGAPQGADDRFCGNCGAVQPATQQPTPEQPAAQQPAMQQPAMQQPTFPEQTYQPTVPQGDPSAFAAPVKAASSFGKVAKWLIPLLALAAAAAVALFLFTDFGNIFKSDEELIRERIQAYEDACNDGDYEAMLECMDAQTQSLMDTTMGLMDGLFSEGTGLGIGMSDMFGLAGLMGDYMNVEIINIAIDGDYATVTVEMSANMYGYEASSGEAELPMVKEDGDWYIGGLDNVLSEQLGMY